MTLNEAQWWTGQDVDGGLALDADKAVQVWAYDAFSHRLLDSFSWTPSKTQCAAGKWLTAFGAALNKSSLGGWLQVGNKEKPASSTAASLWQRGEAIRVFSSLPGRDNWVEGPALASAWKAETDVALVTVRHPYSRVLLGQAVFKPDQLKDQSAWETALAEFIEKQGWPQLRAWRQAADGAADSAAAGTGDWRLWSPRFAGLLVELDNLGDVASYQDSMLDSRRLPIDTPAKAAGSSTSSLESRTALDFKKYLSHGALVVERCKGETVFVLSDTARARGYRVLNVRRCNDKNVISRFAPTHMGIQSMTASAFALGRGGKSAFYVDFDYPDHEAGGAEFEVGYLGYLDDNFLWPRGTAISFKAPAAPPAYTPNNHLCEDYGNTCGSEVFDTAGESETGVDPRTGLFHAHYPIATLQGLRGRGPVCDLTLHYSPLRGNEAGLGDGWAWRFASLEIRDRRLTLADGVTLTFTDEEWTQLGEGKRLQKPACFISCTHDYTTFTLDLPSGRRELLSVPQAAGGDTDEPNDEFRMEIIRLLKAIKKKSTPEFPAKPSTATQWALAVLCVGVYYGAAAIDYAEAMSKWREKTKEIDQQIAYYQRPFVQLLPAEIMSPYGEKLELTWKRQKGQFLLEQVCSGSEQLFKAVYDHARVKMSIWPGSSECFDVQLSLENYLLMKLQRLEKKQVCQQVNCSYAVDPTLDRVLYRLEELDGSVERVEYQAKSAPFKDKRPALPRVGKYRLVAAGGAENHEVSYDYVGSYSQPRGGYTVKISALNNSHHTRYNAQGEVVFSSSGNESFVDLYVRDPNSLSRSVKSVRVPRVELFTAIAWCKDFDVVEYSGELKNSASYGLPSVSDSAPNENSEPVLIYDVHQAAENLEYKLAPETSLGERQPKFALLAFYVDRFKSVESASAENSESIILRSYLGADKLHFSTKCLISVIGEIFYPPLKTNFTDVFRWLNAVEYLRDLKDFACDKAEEVTNDYISDPVFPASSMVFSTAAQLEKITATEGSLTYRYYYQDKGQNSIAPALGLPDLPALACGDIPPETTPPVMAEYQCDAHGNPLGLILYGYRTVLRNARQVIETDTIVTLEGVKATLTADKLDATAQWAFTTTADDVIMRIHQTSTTELKAKTRNDDCAVQVWSATDKALCMYQSILG
ncbi:hypothetical protein HU720_16295 [Pseudomonas sp. SWRI51]|uniref:hypothetical protein n=1 Tax=Pseudomonas sp. SWRI51 TaxID=2745491 RepID=UPI001648D342|nr:hypothetical protein [Pseudomonas sp. SWRI51]MBC3412859.1 hypothetical protein [Pseudomonas sp. SWRI51]